MEQLLSDVKVLDLTHYIAGPFCTKLLADYGADVIKIERPGKGDLARKLGPFPGNVPHTEKSGLFLYLNTNKRGITLNLKSSTGKKIFKKLLRGVDILIESFSPRVMPSLGLSYEALEKINPKLVMTSVSNFGQTGPYRDYKSSEIIIDGMGHAMFSQGEADREPVRMGGHLTQMGGGMMAAVATMVALFSNRRDGIGQHVDVSLMEVQLNSIDRRAQCLVGHAYNPTEISSRTSYATGIGFPFGNFPCADGYFSVAGGAVAGMWEKVVAMLDMPELLEDPRFCTLEAQTHPENYEAFMEILLPWSMQRTKAEIVKIGQGKRAVVLPVNTAEDLVNDPHMIARGSFVEIDHPVVGKVKYPGAPFRINDSFRIRRPAPLLGQHNEEVYGQLGYSTEDLVKLRRSGII